MKCEPITEGTCEEQETASAKDLVPHLFTVVNPSEIQDGVPQVRKLAGLCLVQANFATSWKQICVIAYSKHIFT